MALPIINVEDFKGWVKINSNQFKDSNLEDYITQFRAEYLRCIVGDGAYEAIENESRQKWTDLLEGVYFDDVNGLRRFLFGLRNALIYFIYFEYIRDNFEPTQAGHVQNSFENSVRSPDLSTLNIARSRYNKAVSYINFNLEDFLKVNKELSTPVNSFVDNNDNTYLLNVSNTKYLEAGDSVEIDGSDYVVDAVTANTSIIIEADSVGLDFANEIIVWEPYKLVIFEGLEPCGI